ncbi:hypothetical protein [Deinococcus rubellus]|uniref:Uncharacterized protein n=1 Tax=Deinococcus rubellus TaxID=1889240 RepID=A0ABY5YD84_9DEIO|nr:hypothetical protein [Deinococcus rubellus]UWX62773.1 hypothetical protein N0D28_08300 [Deinococcus rubellus]
MTSKAVTAPTNPHGGATLSALYSTGWGLFGPAPTLWEGGSPAEPGNAPATPAQPAAQPAAPAQPSGGDIARSLQNLIDRQGGSDRAAQLLFDENREYRTRIRTLEGQLPAQGATVLTPSRPSSGPPTRPSTLTPSPSAPSLSKAQRQCSARRAAPWPTLPARTQTSSLTVCAWLACGPRCARSQQKARTPHGGKCAS